MIGIGDFLFHSRPLWGHRWPDVAGDHMRAGRYVDSHVDPVPPQVLKLLSAIRRPGRSNAGGA